MRTSDYVPSSLPGFPWRRLGKFDFSFDHLNLAEVTLLTTLGYPFEADFFISKESVITYLTFYLLGGPSQISN